MPAKHLLDICTRVRSSYGSESAVHTLEEHSAWTSLSAAYRAENRNICVWCRKLVFTISRECSDSISFCIVHADCVTRDQFISQLAI
ncbi:hypothetical protein EXIGLDRAFT_226388 [Exidia glandulosa HHB12029]|uniref:Uncharacterized protein n=1 Tax=Exidia glandulosa HHB12029 TaxID=1314781 RepID=A0A165E981_EXIGL|nr:hypothetical protein EXIGLDRAFT_226388 [Exidia glandulosa HHB12029]